MTHEHLQSVRRGANIGFASVSTLLTVGFFISIPQPNFIEPAIYGVFGASYEAGKLYLMVLVKAAWKDLGRNWARVASAFFLSLLYIFVSLGSAVCSLGWVLYSVEKQSVSFTARASIDGYEESSLRSKIIQYDADLKTLTLSREKNPGDFVTGFKNIDAAIAETRRLRDEADARLITILNEKKAVSAVETSTGIDSNDIFTSLGSIVDLDGYTTLRGIMLALVGVLEIFLFITASPVEKSTKIDVREDPTMVLKFIEALFGDAGPNQRLRSDEAIFKETGMSMKDCARYRSQLMEMRYKDTPLLIKKQTSVVSSFSKENVIKIVKFLSDVGGTK